jgi:hypothetical protein
VNVSVEVTNDVGGSSSMDTDVGAGCVRHSSAMLRRSSEGDLLEDAPAIGATVQMVGDVRWCRVV